jgi:hypothetical protein
MPTGNNPWIAPADRVVLRQLAARVRDIADRPEMEQLRELWRRHNALKGQRPMILCSPEGAWGELVRPEELRCEGELAKAWERSLRQQIFTAEVLRDDQPIEPHLDLSWDLSRGDLGVEIPYTRGENRGSYHWEPPIKDLERDLGRLRFRQLGVDRQLTQQKLSLAGDVLGDLLPPRIHCQPWWTLGLTWDAVLLVGLEQFMLYMVDQPEQVHRLMAFLRDEAMHRIGWYESEGLLSPTNGANYVGSGGVGYTSELPGDRGVNRRPARLRELWGFAESQETVGVSPTMFAEFILPYQMPLLEQFGLNCYGCCEPLHTRIDHVLKIPRLRRISVSPWADQRIMAQKLGDRHIYSRKPKPTLVCAMFDEDLIRRDIRETLEAARGCPIEFVMKDTHTVQNEPHRLARWVQIAREEVERGA